MESPCLILFGQLNDDRTNSEKGDALERTTTNDKAFTTIHYFLSTKAKVRLTQ